MVCLDFKFDRWLLSTVNGNMTSMQAILWGAASVLNLSGTTPAPSYLHRTDEAAIRSDFERVGVLLQEAMDQEPVKVVVESSQPLLPGLAI